MRIAFLGLCTVAAGFATEAVAIYLDSPPLKYLGVVIALIGYAIGFWGVFFIKP